MILALALAMQQPLPELPVARSPLTLVAVTTADGRDAYVYHGQPVPPVIRIRPGEHLSVTLINMMTVPSRESCVMVPCQQATNLHFHGMNVSPVGAADNVLGLLAKPGDTLHYEIDIPKDHPPGLYWYHPHPHGESDRQIEDGMSGALIVDGGPVRGIAERVLVFRRGDERWTINGTARPTIGIAPGERQFWRIVNASSDDFLDLALDGQSLEIDALDGVPLTAPRTADHVVVPPAGRLEAIVTGPALTTPLRTRGFDTGPDGDPQPPAVLAELIPVGTSQAREVSWARGVESSIAYPAEPEATIRFTEDAHGFYINDHKYDPADGPMFTVRVGSFAHWRIVNETNEVHPFHIHQVHFRALPDSVWLDTVDVPPRGTVDVILDARNPVIRGLSVFHCHIIKHEDKGMMAKVLFE